eukprot:TRINITY_DN18247_c0_g1_i1.p1 TRINITY_DN18247_c0_g1~~TRINITY_DN18247_c0_g1_i1.p1  ORF type:complete len:227 (+),score=49.35 TRINITY_DN18247_c0_g1_i1:83-682(+)
MAAAEIDEAVASSVEDTAAEDAEIEEMQRRVREMDEEAEKLKQLTTNDENGQRVAAVSEANREEIDKRSVYVGNVDYGATSEELQEHFKSCGETSRITIMVDRFSGTPKGFAYIEFANEQTVQNSLLLSGSLFRGRQIKVVQKRTNIPGFNPKGKGKGKGKNKGKHKYNSWWDPYESWGWDYGYAPKGGYKGYGKYAPY